jgi:hypothetical protein
MRLIGCFFCLLLLTASFDIAQQQEHDSNTCGFAVQREPIQPTVTGPDDRSSMSAAAKFDL